MSTEVSAPKETREEEEEEEAHPVPTAWSPLRRAILFIFIGIALAFAYSRLHAKALERQNKVIYAKRYSDEYKFRPAASPIVTETLKGGGTKIRGAPPIPAPTPTPKKRTRRTRSSKKKGSTRNSKAAASKKSI